LKSLTKPPGTADKEFWEHIRSGTMPTPELITRDTPLDPVVLQTLKERLAREEANRREKKESETK